MKKLHQLGMLAVLVTALGFASCKGKDKGDSNVPAVTTTTADSSLSVTPTPAPVIVANDEALKTGLTDALKDYPSIKGAVTDSVINLTGNIKRSDWQKLMPTLNSLHPKSVNSTNLTIK